MAGSWWSWRNDLDFHVKCSITVSLSSSTERADGRAESTNSSLSCITAHTCGSRPIHRGDPAGKSYGKRCESDATCLPNNLRAALYDPHTMALNIPCRARRQIPDKD